MYARVTRFKIKTESIERARDLYEKSVIPAAKSQKGFERVMVLVDSDTGLGQAITFWTTEDDAVANEKNLYYQQQLIKFMNLFTVPPVREGYQVIIEA